MIGSIITLAATIAGPFLRMFSPTRKLMHALSQFAGTDVEHERIKAEAQTKLIEAQASVISTGMQHRMFWVPWSIAAIPTAAWFGWGMLDSLFNGALPDVAALPPQLRAYADVVWNNIFLSGGIVAGGTAIASAIRRR